MGFKDELITTLDKQLVEWEGKLHQQREKLQELQVKVDQLEGQAKAEGQEVLQKVKQHIHDIESKLEAGKKELEKLQHATEEAWEDVKSGVQTAWENVKSGVEAGWSNMKQAIDQASSKFK